MKKCLFFGNCQQYPLKVLLRSVDEFNDQYTIIDDLAPMHMWGPEQVQSVENRYFDADIIITQPIRDARFGLAKTMDLLAWNSKTKRIPVIVFPNIEFLASFPFAIHVPVDLENDSVPDSHCAIVFLCFISGLSIENAIQFCRSFYNDESRSDIYRTIYKLSMDRLELAERSYMSEVHVSYLFRNRYKDIKLSHNRLHPSNYVCEYVANRVLAQIGIFKTVNTPGMEFWAHDAMPIMPAIRKALGLTYKEDGLYYVKGILKRLEDYIYHYYCYYNQHQTVVEKGIEHNKAKLSSIIEIVNNNYRQVDMHSLFSW